ncbi:MAG: signal peptidase II [Anaerolineales bacterium]
MNTSASPVEMTRFEAAWKKVISFFRRHGAAYLFLFAIAGASVGLDQWTKEWVRTHIPLGGDWLPPGLEWLLPYARIRHWYNTGSAFGFFKDGSLLFMMLAIIVSTAIVYLFWRVPRQEWYLRVALGLQLGGALGNLIDRLRFDGRVTDFISVGEFAVFNIADSSITLGVVILALGVYLRERALQKARRPLDEPSWAEIVEEE